jgi:hypothetical protein
MQATQVRKSPLSPSSCPTSAPWGRLLRGDEAFAPSPPGLEAILSQPTQAGKLLARRSPGRWKASGA